MAGVEHPLFKAATAISTGQAGHKENYFRHARSGDSPPKLALCGFTRVHLDRGKAHRISIEIPAERFRCWDLEKKRYVVEPGNYEILIGEASDDIRLKLRVTIAAP